MDFLSENSTPIEFHMCGHWVKWEKVQVFIKKLFNLLSDTVFNKNIFM